MDAAVEPLLTHVSTLSEDFARALLLALCDCEGLRACNFKATRSPFLEGACGKVEERLIRCRVTLPSTDTETPEQLARALGEACRAEVIAHISKVDDVRENLSTTKAVTVGVWRSITLHHEGNAEGGVDVTVGLRVAAVLTSELAYKFVTRVLC